MDTCRVNVPVDYPQAVQVSNGSAKLPEDKHELLSWEANITEWLPRGNVFRWLCLEHQRLNFFKQDGRLKQTKNILVIHLLELIGKFESHFLFFSWQDGQIDAS